jgi:quercetin dioxygenase-like cupin family protein
VERSANGKENDMSKQEPYATEEEFRKRVVHYPDIPPTELAPASMSHLVVGEQAVVSFLTMPAKAYFPVHQHEAEQIMIVLDGYMDEIIEGKLYRVKKGDVLILPSNIPHGGQIREVDCRVIDIFAPPRADLVEKAKKAMAKMKG